MRLVFIYLLIINLFTFYLFGLDKKKARLHQWRIPESKLLLVAIFGGSLGGLMGMLFFRHKIRKIKFVLGIPVILVVQLFLLYFLQKQGTSMFS